MKFIAHNTGGGIPGKFRDPLEKACGYGAYLHDLWEPCDLMLTLQEVGKPKRKTVSDENAYSALGMGNGGFMVVESNEETIGRAIKIAAEHGIEARDCGTIRKEPGITLVSKGRWREGKEIDF